MKKNSKNSCDTATLILCTCTCSREVTGGRLLRSRGGISRTTYCTGNRTYNCKGCQTTKYSTLDWVNLCQKFEIEKYTVCGKLILPKKWKGIFGHNWLANLHGFANICKLPVSNTFKDMHSKFDRK